MITAKDAQRLAFRYRKFKVFFREIERLILDAAEEGELKLDVNIRKLDPPPVLETGYSVSITEDDIFVFQSYIGRKLRDTGFTLQFDKSCPFLVQISWEKDYPKLALKGKK